jgi:hypothetical protein
MYEEDAVIHVISAEFVCRSRPMEAVMTLIIPLRKEDMPISIVAVMTRRTSGSVELKQAGRPRDC